MRNVKNGQKMKLTKIAAVTLSAALIFGCDDLELKETAAADTDNSGEVEDGVDGADSLGQYAIITNTEADSSGQLRYDVAEAQGAELTEGQLNVDVFYSSSETETTYISLFNADTNTSGLIGEVQLDEGNVKVRSGDSTTVSTFTTGTWVNVNVTWDVATATYTVSINDTEIGTYNFHNPDATGVDTIGFKVANNAATESEEFLVDNITIYSDAAGTTEVFSDDFESYVFDEILDGAGDPYNDETQPAIVGGETAEEETGTEAEVTDSTQVAAIADTDTDDTGELRYQLSDALAVGQVNMSFLYNESETETAALTVYSNGGTSTSRGEHIADLQLDSGTISLRNVGEISTFIPGEWVYLQINWSTDGSQTADVTVTIDGVEVHSYNTPYSAGDNEDTGAKNIQVRYAGGSATTEFTLYADDLTIYSDAGTTEVFSDDFEGYTVGAVLDEIEGTVYHSNSSEATVAAQPNVAE